MYIFKYFIVLLTILIFWSCSQDTDPLTSQPAQTIAVNDVGDLRDLDNDALAKWGRNAPIRVMTRNIYIGTDVDVVLSAEDPADIPVLAAQAFQTLVATNFPERAVSLAREIAITRPDLIGLQEVTIVRLQSPGDAIAGGTTPAEILFMDYLEIFMAALKAMGLNYEVAAKIQNADVELPMLTGADPLTFDDVRVTDFDVILVKKQVKVSDIFTANYQYNLVIPDLGVEILRGYAAVDAKVNGKSYRFVNTHLEPFSVQIQLAQIQELMAWLSGEELPVVLVGDFNSEAPLGDTYNYILSQGYDDIWMKNLLWYNRDGFTYGHDPDLMNETAEFWQRIDHIYVKNSPGSMFNVAFPVLAIVVGDEQFNRTPSGLWPSDHGGVVARFALPKIKSRFANNN